MKIAFFHELTPLSGARKVVEEYGKIFTKKNVVDLYYVDNKNDNSAKKIFKKVFYYEFKEKKWQGGNWRNKLYKDTLELINLYFLHKKIAKTINENNYDFIFVSPSKFTQAPFILNFLNIKTVYYCQEPLRIVYDKNLQLDKNISIFKKFYELVNRYIRKLIDLSNLNKVTLIVSNSNFSRNNIKKFYGKNSYVCYLGIDPEKYISLNLKKKYDLLFIGEKNSIEGYDLLQNTLKIYKNKPTVKIVSRDINGKGISEKDLIKEYNESRILLSLSKSEPFGLTPIEAMACKTVVIAINEGGFSESIINGKTGFLVNPNSKSIKTYIDSLLNSNELYLRIADQANKYVLEKFTWEISANNFMKIISKNL